MKTFKLFSTVVALAFVFSACNKDLPDAADNAMGIKAGTGCFTTQSITKSDYDNAGTEYKGSETVKIANGITLAKVKGNFELAFDMDAAPDVITLSAKSGNAFTAYSFDTECAKGTRHVFDAASGIKYGKSKNHITMVTEQLDVRINLNYGPVDIDWGDGSPIEKVDSFSCWGIVHSYSVPASRTITITGENITYFNCSLNKLTKLDVSNNIKLETLSCGANQLTSLDVSANSNLASLNCGNNQLTNLNLGNSSILTNLSCSENQLTSLDVSKCAGLAWLYCFDNRLTGLDLKKNASLTTLGCWDNQLTSLDLSKNKKLYSLQCYNNYISTSSLNSLFRSLPAVDWGYLAIEGNPGSEDCNRSIAADKGWTFWDE